MKPDISVIMNDNEKITSFFEARKIAIYKCRGDVWERCRDLPVHVDRSIGREALRAETLRIIDLLGSCRIITGRGIRGVPYTEFDRRGFYIFEADDYSPYVFDGIAEDIESDIGEAALKEKIIRNACPVETSIPGVYFLDLVMLQMECPEVSSKQAMREFFEKTPFSELHLVCAHIPPWLEGMGLQIDSRRAENGSFRAVIRKKQCGGD